MATAVTARGQATWGRRRFVAFAVAVATIGALSGCVSIPTTGPIGTGAIVTDDPGVAVSLPAGPEPGASPEEIVAGFLRAGAAAYNEFDVAHDYLTGDATDWNARARTVIYTNRDPDIVVRDDGEVLVTVGLVATIDEAGRYLESATNAKTQVAMSVEKNSEGEWRISNLQDGVLMSLSSFEDAYRDVSVYFSTPDRTQLVPDLRWFPTGKAVTLAAEALFVGASPWLRDGVITGAPEGMKLSGAAVTVTDNHVARLELTGTVGGDRNLLQAQLEATLGDVPDTIVTGVEVRVSGWPWEPDSELNLERDVSPPGGGPYVLSGDVLAQVEGGQVVPVEGVAPVTGVAANSPAVSLDEQTHVVLDGTTGLLLLPLDGSAPVELMTGTRLLAPTIDRNGWIWTGEQSSNGVLTAVRPEGMSTEVSAEWLDGRQVRSIRVSRDGSRIAIISVGSDAVPSIDVTAVVRDEEGTPQRLGAVHMTVGQALTDASQVAWLDEVTLAVLGTSGAIDVPTVHTVPLGGPSEALTLLDGTVGIAATRGRPYLVDSSNNLRMQQGASWTVVAQGVRDPTFPG